MDSCRLRLLAAGNGPPLLYLHGAGGPAPWSPFFVELAKSFRVIAPDHPGFGRSGEPSWLAGIDDLAYFYLDFLAAQGLDRVHLVGHSMGGWIAMEAAVRSTARLKSLTLLDPAGIYVKGHPMADIFITPPAETWGSSSMSTRASPSKRWPSWLRPRRKRKSTRSSATAPARRSDAGSRGCTIRSSPSGCTASTCRRILFGAIRIASSRPPMPDLARRHTGRAPDHDRALRPRAPGRARRGDARRRHRILEGMRAVKILMFHLMPYAHIDLAERREIPRGVGEVSQQQLRSGQGPRALQPLSRRAGIGGRAGLGRGLP